jgi:hypothetical protein
MAYAYICRAISTTTKREELSNILNKYCIPKNEYEEFYWYDNNANLNKITGNLYLKEHPHLQEDMYNITQENFKIAQEYLQKALTGPFGKY